MRRTITGILAVVLFGCAFVATADVAAAATPRMTSDGSVRDCINTDKYPTGCKSRYTIRDGTTLKMHCWQLGSYGTGEFRTNMWFYITTTSGTVRKGWVHASRVWPQTKVGNCYDISRGISAARWASENVGTKSMTSSERTYTGGGPYWSGWCAGFAASAYHYTGREPRFLGDAGVRYKWYRDHRLITTTGTPSVGAEVFYPYVSSTGHVAIYVGNGYIASTMGDRPESRSVARVDWNSYPDYGKPAGWVNPGNV